MALAPGTRLGPYEIIAAIGAGGMGEVYRARDTKLNRDVAIKVLPEAFASDPERLARFTREAQTLASLNHPNIAHVHGFEESNAPAGSGQGAVRALVMELVEGEDLSAQIARGPIPIAEALPIARQIAEALEAAHEHGIVHRDLKPANIKVGSDGAVKVLDFGLAKAMGPGVSNPDVSHSPTLTGHGTQVGLIIGTAAYMSPEQAKGKTVDRRADIWAFGVVLYEMLTGTRAFKGDDVSDTLASVLKDTLNMEALPSTTPPRLKRLIGRCLDRDLKTRLRDIGEARVKIAQIEGGAPDSIVSAAATTVAPLPLRYRALPWAFLAVCLALIACLVAWAPWRPAPVPAEMRVEIVAPAGDDPTSFALSPDGRQIVFEASGDGGSRLWLRSLATTTSQPLTGTEGGRFPFWSPDSRSIGFFAGDKLKRLDLGGAAQTLTQAVPGHGGAWNADGDIIFAPHNSGPLMRLPAAGGEVVTMTTLGPRQQGHRWPCFLPDGRRFLFYVMGAPEIAGIYLGSVDGTASARLTSADSAGSYLPGGWVLWLRGDTLVARQLDVSGPALTGEPVTLAEGVLIDGAFQRSAASVATSGLVAFRRGGVSLRQLKWFDRSGTARGAVGDPDDSYLDPRVSPDGRHVAVARTKQGNIDLWLMDGLRASRFTFDAAEDRFPLWSLDGLKIAFRSHRTGGGDIYEKLTSGGAGGEERLLTSEQRKAPNSWSPDGRFLMFHSVDPQTSNDLWIMPMSADRKPWVFLKTPFRESVGGFSPDGRWVVYFSNESGQAEIYVRPFVVPGSEEATREASEQRQVSTAGGIMPVWRQDGKELFYLNPAGDLMASPIRTTRDAIEPGTPIRLFPTRIVGGGVDHAQGRQYDVTADGRFLINTVVGGAREAPITLLMNWNPEGKK